MSGVSGDFPPGWSAAVYSAAHLSVCVVSFSKFHEPDTRDVLAMMSRGCCEETAFVEFKLYAAGALCLASHRPSA